MSIDITPVPSAGRLIIQSYGDGKFTINARVIHGSVMLFDDRLDAWPVNDASEITVESLQPLLAEADGFDILLVGCGNRSKMPPKDIREAVKAAGLVLEWMDSGAAARTYTVLQTEDRRVLAAIIAV